MSVKIFWCEWDGKTDSHELLRQALGKYLNRELDRLVVEQEENGKPRLRDWSGVHFSISHSGNIWSCAVGDGPLGLDLQKQYEKNGEKLARRFFHPEEIAWMEIHGFGQFSRIWTYKESYVKYTGTGLREGLDYFSVIPGIRAERQETEACIYQQEIPFLENYWMVLTSRGRPEILLEQFTEERAGKQREGGGS